MSEGTEKKKIGIVGAVIWFVAAIVMIVYAFTLPKTNNGKKEIILEIKFADNIYRYEELTTNTNNLYSLFAQYDAYLQLGFSYREVDQKAIIAGFKGSYDVNGCHYVCKINGNEITYPIAEQSFKDGDVITVEYLDEGGLLAAGGNDTLKETPDSSKKPTFLLVGGACAIVGLATLVSWYMRKKKEKNE